MSNNFKSGFISIIGKPNVGKSTLLNTIIGHKIAIMSDKPQTTRNTVLGVYTTSDAQIIFTDTPGIHHPHDALGEFMNDSSYNSIKGVDAIFYMVTATDRLNTLDKEIIERLKNTRKPIYLIINKIDLLKKKSDLDKVVVQYMNELPFKGIYPVSALEKTNVDTLLEEIKGLLPEGPKYYPDDMISDHPERFIIGELIREKILQLTREEVPHSVAVTVDSLKKLPEEEDLVEIYATIYVERQSQKKIIIGNGGSLIKEIKRRAKKDIKALLGSQCVIDLWVKVKEDWKDRKDVLRTLGYSKDNY
ncbi:MAG: GTPase Era [Acholeplasmatales bacterium]|nr:GTPase Era [Acholeplasmatales bacterium]